MNQEEFGLNETTFLYFVAGNRRVSHARPEAGSVA